jgi:hypothetical protein
MERKVVWTLMIKGYPTQMTNLTLPWIKAYARKIGATLQIIDERKHPEWPVTAEKLQIWEDGKDNDWNVFIDADALISPELFDVTALVSKDTVVFTGQDMAAMRFVPDIYAIRDGRYLGACSWFVVSSNWTHDLWRPLDANLQQIIEAGIWPTNGERISQIGTGGSAITPDKLIEDYILSNNIARFGLKHTTIEGHLKPKFGRGDAFYWHQYTMGIDQKIITCLGVMQQWGLLTPEISKEYGPYLKKLQTMQAEQIAARQDL